MIDMNEIKSEIASMNYYEFKDFRDEIEDIITSEEEKRFNIKTEVNNER